jgi:hypothetical protein
MAQAPPRSPEPPLRRLLRENRGVEGEIGRTHPRVGREQRVPRHARVDRGDDAPRRPAGPSRSIATRTPFAASTAFAIGASVPLTNGACWSPIGERECGRRPVDRRIQVSARPNISPIPLEPHDEQIAQHQHPLYEFVSEGRVQ